MAKLLLYFLFLGLLPVAQAPNTQQMKKDFTTAFSKGDTSPLQNYFKGFVNMNIPGNNGFFSETKAQWLLQDFFKKNKVSGFSLKEEGFAGVNYYFIGLYHSHQTRWNIYFLFSPGNNGFQIQQIDIEESDS
jgi:hypothetical protein